MPFLQKAKLKTKHWLQAPKKEPVKKKLKKSPKKKYMKMKTTTRTSPERMSRENSSLKLNDQKRDAVMDDFESFTHRYCRIPQGRHIICLHERTLG